MFWEFHDPTSAHSERQYISLILYETPEEKEEAGRSMKESQAKFRRPITTEISPLGGFHQAELYHQKYLLRNTHQLFDSLKLEGQALVDSKLATKLNAIAGGYAGMDALNSLGRDGTLTEHQMKALQAVVATGGVHMGCSI